MHTIPTTSSMMDRMHDAWPQARHLASEAEATARQQLDRLAERSQALRLRAGEAGERGLTYLRNEPIKPVLIAAVAAGALMALAQWMARRSAGRL